jgi:hypothetical protein
LNCLDSLEWRKRSPPAPISPPASGEHRNLAMDRHLHCVWRFLPFTEFEIR